MIKRFEKNKAKRLIQKSVDNALSEQEQKELKRLLSRNPELSEYYESLEEVDQNLKDMALDEGDTDVSDAVMKKVKASGSHDEWYKFPGNRNAAISYSSFSRYAVAAAIGILIGVGSMILVSQSDKLSNEEVYGTLISEKAAKGINFLSNDDHVRMIPYLQKDLLYLNFFIDTKDAFDITIDFNISDYIPIAQQSSTTTRVKGIRFDTGSVTFACTGQASAQIIIRKKKDHSTKPLLVKVSRNGTEVFSKKIDP